MAPIQLISPLNANSFSRDVVLNKFSLILSYRSPLGVLGMTCASLSADVVPYLLGTSMSTLPIILNILVVSIVIVVILLFVTRFDTHRKKTTPTPEVKNLGAVLDALMTFACVMLPDGTITEANAMACAVIDVPREALLGKKFWDATWWAYSEECRVTIRSFTEDVAKGRSINSEVSYQDGKGNIRHLEFSMAPVRDDAGVITYLVSSGRDIEERRIFEAEIIKARTEAEIANQAKSVFMASMSHELRTPIGIILGFSDLAINDIDPMAKTQHLQTIKRNALLLLALVDEILDVGKVESGQVSIDIEDVNLAKFIDDLSTSLVLKASERGISLKFDIATDSPPLIRTDPLRLKQILFNIIGNAIKYTPKGTIACSIRREISQNQDEAQISFEVTDTGIGISEADAKRLFEPFSRGREGEQKKYSGTGLGLALSRRLARILGGDIQLIKSEPGMGSTFKVTVAEQRSVDSTIAKLGKYFLGGLPIDAGLGRLSGMRVLVVDDVADNRVLISKILTQEGANVHTASGGNEAIAMGLQDGFHAVLMDLSMPELSGQETTTELRKKGYKIPIIALTAHAMRDERDKALSEGFNYYLTKPIVREVLIEALAGILRGYLEFSAVVSSKNSSPDKNIPSHHA
jgi:PAS domain S-box-containing protein